MKKDIEISNEATLLDINSIAKKIEVEDYIENYGKYKAKINYEKISKDRKAKLILVTSINPTPYGEGKTTVSIGLGDALNYLGKKEITVLREPSLGPVFGIKGGATGGGYAQVVPMEDINLHFTGDLHAITSANNLISSSIDNHIYFGNTLNIDENKVVFRRCIDLNDRTLRNITLNEKKVKREEHFNITAASEMMSVLCLSKNLKDLKKNIGNIIVAYSKENTPIYAKDLKVEGSCAVLLKDAIKPNLVQTLENNPVIIHGGPFANIAHGCNSIIATDLALKLTDYVVTEAGFGSDLGAEKFLDIKCPKMNAKPDCIVLVATIKALKYNAKVEKENILIPNKEKTQEGLCNLEAHLTNLLKYTKNIVVCLNKYETDTKEEIEIVEKLCKKYNVAYSETSSFKEGSKGSINLAKKVIEVANYPNDFKPLYDVNLSIKEKISIIAKEIYHAGNILYTQNANEKIKKIEEMNYSNLPICIAKTQYSLSDNPELLGFPKDFDITVKDISLYLGSGFITVLLKDILTLPGLPKIPNYEKIDIDDNNQIIGLF